MTKEEFEALNITRGTLVGVAWNDILNDATGDPDKASLCLRKSFALLWNLIESHGHLCIVTTNTIDQGDVAEQQGWYCVPLALVKEIEIIKRPKKPRKKKEKPSDGTSPI